jgi:hypothetical protein
MRQILVYKITVEDIKNSSGVTIVANVLRELAESACLQIDWSEIKEFLEEESMLPHEKALLRMNKKIFPVKDE